MKQLIINGVDDGTHAWLEKLAKSQRRTMAQQALFILESVRGRSPRETNAKKKAL